MKKNYIIKFSILSLFIILASFIIINPDIAYAEGIEWIESYDEGIKEAKAQDKNMFILITAPSWCGPCQWMEKYTFTDTDVISLVNEGFVPVKILDTNPDVNRFNFMGYPTVFIFNQNKKKLAESVGAKAAKELIKIVKDYAIGVESGEDTTEEVNKGEKYNYNGGYFEYIGDGIWIEVKLNTKGESEIQYEEVSRDENYIIIYDEARDYYIALPLVGNVIWYREGEAGDWEQYNNLTDEE